MAERDANMVNSELSRSENEKNVKNVNIIHIKRKKIKKRKKKASGGSSSYSDSDNEYKKTVNELKKVNDELKKANVELLARYERIIKVCETNGININDNDKCESDVEMISSEAASDNEEQADKEVIKTKDVNDTEIDSSEPGSDNEENPDKEDVKTADKYKKVINKSKKKGKPSEKTAITSDKTPNKNKVEIKEIKPAPIYIREKTSKVLVNIILEAVGEGNFHTVMANSSPPETKVQVYNIKSFRTITAELEKRKINYYTYQLKNEKGLTVVIKGIEPEVEIEEIREDLESKGFKVKNVHNILNKAKIPQPLHIVELEPETHKPKKGEIHDIYKVKYIIHRKIIIEEPRRRIGPVQCHNCQEYGHTKAYCKLSAVCVICGDNHQASDCKKDRKDPTTKFCKNCGENHTANYRGCQVYAHFKNQLNQHKKRQTQVPLPAPTVTPGVSFASAVKGSMQPMVNKENNNSELMSIMIEIMREMKEQSRLLLNHLNKQNE